MQVIKNDFKSFLKGCYDDPKRALIEAIKAYNLYSESQHPEALRRKSIFKSYIDKLNK